MPHGKEQGAMRALSVLGAQSRGAVTSIGLVENMCIHDVNDWSPSGLDRPCISSGNFKHPILCKVEKL